MAIKMQSNCEPHSCVVSQGSSGQLERSSHSVSLRQGALVDITSKGCIDLSLEVNLCTSLKL